MQTVTHYNRHIHASQPTLLRALSLSPIQTACPPRLSRLYTQPARFCSCPPAHPLYSCPPIILLPAHCIPARRLHSGRVMGEGGQAPAEVLDAEAELAKTVLKAPVIMAEVSRSPASSLAVCSIHGL